MVSSCSQQNQHLRLLASWEEEQDLLGSASGSASQGCPGLALQQDHVVFGEVPRFSNVSQIQPTVAYSSSVRRGAAETEMSLSLCPAQSY